MTPAWPQPAAGGGDPLGAPCQPGITPSPPLLHLADPQQGSDQIRQAFSKRKKGLVLKSYQLFRLTDAKVRFAVSARLLCMRPMHKRLRPHTASCLHAQLPPSRHTHVR